MPQEGLLSCSYRIAQDGLLTLLPYVMSQRFQPTVEEFISIITDRWVGGVGELPDWAQQAGEGNRELLQH